MGPYGGKGVVPKPKKCQNMAILPISDPIWGAVEPLKMVSQ